MNFDICTAMIDDEIRAPWWGWGWRCLICRSRLEYGGGRCDPEMSEGSKRVDILFPRTLPLGVIDHERRLLS
jgi:hypothetical protein